MSLFALTAVRRDLADDSPGANYIDEYLDPHSAPLTPIDAATAEPEPIEQAPHFRRVPVRSGMMGSQAPSMRKTTAHERDGF